MKVPVNSLILDYDLYPRSSVDRYNVNKLVDAALSGAKLPPVKIDKKTRKVVDGFHRCHAALKVDGENAKIEVEEVEYGSPKDMFLDAIALNAHHGVQLDKHDIVHCMIRAGELRLSLKSLSEVLDLPIKKLQTLKETRTATLARLKSNGKKGSSAAKKRRLVSLKNTAKHMAGKELTKSQWDANKKLGGMNQAFYVNQLILLIEEELLDTGNEKLMELLRHLYSILGGVLV